MKNFRCDRCGVYFDSVDKFTYQWPDIPGIGDRCEPGSRVPAAQCPVGICHGLVYPCRPPPAREIKSAPSELGHALYTVMLDIGDSQTFLETVQVPLATPADERLHVAVRRAREAYCEVDGFLYDEDTNNYPVLAVFDGAVRDIWTEDA